MMLPFEYRVGSSEYTINDMEVPCLKLAHHLRQQVWPLARKIFTTYYADGIRQLKPMYTNT